jgi:hypothetical protein
MDIELKGDGAFDIHVNTLIIAYLQTSEVSIGFTPKERDQIMHKTKRFKWEGNSLLCVDRWTSVNGISLKAM